MRSKHFILATLLLSAAACATSSSDDGAGGEGGSGAPGGVTGTAGTNSSNGGTTGTAGGTGGSVVPSGAGGSSGTGGGAGTVSAGAGGSSAGGYAGTSASGSAGTSAGGVTGAAGTSSHPAGGTGGTSVVSGTGGSSTGTAVKCNNLSLAPSTTGVAKPAGAAGGLKVLDWAGFKGAASFTFDDNTPSQLPNYNALKATGGHFTWFLIGQSSGTGYKDTIADGQEVANHTQTHGNPSQQDVITCQGTLKTKYGVDAYSMAAPNCADGWSSMAAPAKLFQNRGPCGGVPTVSPRDSTSPFLLPAYLPPSGADTSNLSGQIAAGKWRIYVIHGFDSQNGTYQPVPIASVTGAMSKAVSDGHWVEGMTNVGAYWQGQKLISASATTSATWTVPANFPPNMCVRITTTGGNVTQKGQAIPWDAHGYYQIGLDAGEVTIQ